MVKWNVWRGPSGYEPKLVSETVEADEIVLSMKANAVEFRTGDRLTGFMCLHDIVGVTEERESGNKKAEGLQT